MTAHPFDAAIALQFLDGQPGKSIGRTTPAYRNMVGPFGGVTAAVMLQAVLQHPALLGVPVAMTVNFAAAVAEGAFDVQATPVRTNRSTQHWTVDISQPGADGAHGVTTTATVVTATRRETWGESDLPMPDVPKPDQLDSVDTRRVPLAWLERYEMRSISGEMPSVWDGRVSPSESMLWMRDGDGRPLDFVSLAALTDLFFPRVMLRRAKQVPIGTVSMTTYFHADAERLAEAGSGFLLGRAVGQQFFNGYCDQAAQLWSEAGVLLATSNQLLYFRE